MVPALCELHLHLDGSLNILWAYQTALKRKAIEPDVSFEDFYHILYRTDYASRQDGFRKFEVTCDCLQTKEDLHDASYNLAHELHDLGMIYAEIRFAPQQHCKKGLTQDDAVKAVISGLEDAAVDFPDLHCHILNCMMHKGDSALFNDAENRETIEVTRKNLGQYVAGLDLAGYENNCPLEDYAYLFETARSYGIPYTIHAGEMGNGANVHKAIEMKADRIGHGVDCVQNEAWLKEVVDLQIPLEVCVTSNCKHNVPYGDHPIRRLLAAGANVSINSDNMMFANTCAHHEYLLLSRLGVSDSDLIRCTYNAINAAFCSEEEKKQLRKEAEKRYAAYEK